MPEMKRSSNTGYSQPRHLPVPEPAIRAFHITMNSPLLQSASINRPKFRLETNSTVPWLYTSDVSSILPDVRFGTVSLDQVTNSFKAGIRLVNSLTCTNLHNFLAFIMQTEECTTYKIAYEIWNHSDIRMILCLIWNWLISAVVSRFL